MTVEGPRSIFDEKCQRRFPREDKQGKNQGRGNECVANYLTTDVHKKKQTTRTEKIEICKAFAGPNSRDQTAQATPELEGVKDYLQRERGRSRVAKEKNGKNTYGYVQPEDQAQ